MTTMEHGSVSAGRGEPLVVLDAMKMDTYVNSSRDGIVASVDCAVGDSVSLGQQLLTLE